MKMNEKFYEAPEVEVVEVAIEQGFAATDGEYTGIDDMIDGGDA